MVVMDPTQETMALSVINQLASAIVELSAITKIHKYKRFHERDHFISMAMEVHCTLGCDMDHFMKKCACVFHDKQSGIHLSSSFCIQIFR
jgi:hypothetical protein